ncbi:MAG: hypothetical protein EHM86_03430 [Desulfobulbaceae bacterium]|nr:MAG: hypothetical protein EHM86_03430 [Desulfobulbaceae bacterium]
MYKRLLISQSTIFSVLSFFICLSCTVAFSADTVPGKEKSNIYQISKIQTNLDSNTLTLDILGGSEPAYTVSERFSPFRVVLDIAEAAFDQSINPQSALFPANAFVSLQTSTLSDQAPPITRFEFTIADSHDYKVSRNGNNIKIQIMPAIASSTPKASTPPAGSVPTLTDILVKTSPSATTIAFVSSAPLVKYTSDKFAGNAGKKPQMFIDIENVNISELVREKKVGTSVDKILVAPQGTGARIIFDSAKPDLFDYTISDETGVLTVTIQENPTLPGAMTTSPKPSAENDKTLDSLISETENMLAQDGKAPVVSGKPVKAKSAIEDTFAFAGYNKERISVDFYKIDLHNVFRLFRQVTNLNIIVDESVTGSLTLALSDVPWDFALDIILNLADLKKEERFNTIVIYPKKKEFVWPERMEDNLTVEADTEIVEQDALVIEQSANLSQEVLAAQELLRKAQIADEGENYEEAADLYEQANKLWPTNAKISNRLATLYLVNLGVNAKAVHYAKESLKQEPTNTRAALYAAVASANMQRNQDAVEYFTQSISGTPPMKEALISYATFCENSGRNDQAITLLDKYNAAYGETIDTMISKARIFDKMGNAEKATQQYKAIIASGFPLAPDLKKFIHGRLAAKGF